MKFSKPILLLAVLLCLTFAFSCGDTKNPSDAVTDESKTEEGTGFTLDESFVIVRSDTDEDGIKAAQYIRDAIRSVYGLELSFVTDFVRRGEEIVPNEKEILIGKTNRPDASPIYEGMRAKDFRYAILNEHCVVIAGGNAESNLEAAKAFCRDVFGYTGEGTGTPVPFVPSAPVIRDYGYKVKNLTLNGSPLSDWVIVTGGETPKELAVRLSESIAEYSGEQLKIVSSVKGSAEHAVYLRGINGNAYSSYDIVVREIDGDVYLEAGNETGLERAVELFLEAVKPEKVTETLDLAFTEERRTYSFIGGTYDFTDQAAGAVLRLENGLTLKKKTETTVCPGVKSLKLEYRDYDKRPVVCYVLVCEPGSVTPVCGLPHANTDIHTGRLQNVIEQAQAAEAAYGYDLCAAVNGDLAYSSTEPCGTNYQSGVCLSHNEEFCFFAVKKDGSFFVGYDDDLDSFDHVAEAIGGRYLMLKDGKLTDLGWGVDFAYTRHPRTAVGFDDEGRLYIMVVDGRQPSVSNGASLPDMAMIFIELGATNAINIDGGGSSTFVTKDYGTGEFRYHNSPSDGYPRSVINSLLFIRNENYGE